MEDKASPDWVPPPDAALTLTAENFDETINNNEIILVEFYAPWCGYCKKFAPAYEKAAKELQKLDPAIPIAKVDGTVETTLATRFGVNEYPTIKLFRNGNPTEYEGDLTRKAIVKFMKRQSGDASLLKETAKAARNTISKYDISVVGYFENENTPLFKTYMEAANKMRNDYNFYHTFAQGKDIQQNSIAVFLPSQLISKFESKWYTLSKSDASVQEITDFITKHRVPLVGEMSKSALARRYEEIRPLVIAFYSQPDYSHKSRKGKCNFSDIILIFHNLKKMVKTTNFVVHNVDNHYIGQANQILV